MERLQNACYMRDGVKAGIFTSTVSWTTPTKSGRLFSRMDVKVRRGPDACAYLFPLMHIEVQLAVDHE